MRRKTRLRRIAVLAIVAAIGVAGLFRAWVLPGDEVVELRFVPGEAVGHSEGDLLAHRASYAIQVCCAKSTALVTGVAGHGRDARLFRVTPQDPLVKGSFRSELRVRPNLVGEHVWYRASVYVPADWKPSGEKVLAMQWHGTRDWIFLEPGKAPPLEIEILGGEWVVQKSWDRRIATPPRGAVEGLRRIGRAPLETGRWLEWTIEARWSADADGLLRVWLDGMLVVDDRGPNAHRDLIGPYMKVGVYVPGWHFTGIEPSIHERTLYFSGISVRPGADPYGLLASGGARAAARF